MDTHPVYASIAGPIVIIGFGSIGRGTLPLIERHFDFDRSKLTVIDPHSNSVEVLKALNVRHLPVGLSAANYREILSPLFAEGRGFCVNLSVDTCSLDIMRLCRESGVLYIDTVVEPWAGFYYNTPDNASRTNYALRHAVREEAAAHPGGPTAVSCCGANPGMVSWLLKEALLLLAADAGIDSAAPDNRDGWATLMQQLDVHGVQIAERDSQARAMPRPDGVFVNTWSVEGFMSEGLQPAELGWGTKERWTPPIAHSYDYGCQASIWLYRPGADTRVRSWCPALGAQLGFLVTHNEAISIADYYTVGTADNPDYRPTCYYAYHPCDDAVLSLHEMLGSGNRQSQQHILTAEEIVEGGDELGVLIYGQKPKALWYGSRLSNAQAHSMAPDQNATGLQVTSAVVAGMVWALENPEAGIVEADEMDHVRCLEVQRLYLGAVEAHYTDWTPLAGQSPHFPGDTDPDDPWQFRNLLMS